MNPSPRGERLIPMMLQAISRHLNAIKHPLLLLLLLSALCGFAQQPSPGTIDGSIVDQSGSPIAGAHISILFDHQTAPLDFVSDSDGRFSTQALAGSFRVTITASGFAAQTSSGVLHPAESLTLPRIVLQLATLTTDVQVTLTPVEIADAQLKTEEKQRLVGAIPNYYVTYEPKPAPLTSKQKFGLAGKFIFDPVTFGVNGIIAGVQQAQNDYRSFGQGTEGYAKRYAASYGSFLTSTMISQVILPSLLKQDPRYYYKGKGTKRSRILYALSRSIIRQGDNGQAQFNYSTIFGDLAAGGISRFYYPASDRDGAGITFRNAAIGIGGDAIGNLFQEFFSRKLTPKKAPPDRP